MKILVAVNEFKGSLTSKELAITIKDSILSMDKSIDVSTEVIADGGDGFLEMFNGFSKGTFLTKNALNENIEASYLINKESTKSVIEVAEVIGLKKVEDRKNPYIASTYGLGLLIAYLLNRGVKDFYIGLGGSATNDCGIGMLSALGYKFYNENGEQVIHGISALKEIVAIDDINVLDKLKEANFTLISDVENILYGEKGATYVFSAQKGLPKEDFNKVDCYVKNFSYVVFKYNNRNYSLKKGSGAAGGLGYGFLSFMKSKIVSGSSFMIDYLQLDSKIRKVDLLITGEGKLDSQSFMGKAPIELAKLAKKHNKKVIFLAGSIMDDELNTLDNNEKNLVDISLSIQRRVLPLEELMNKQISKKNVEKTIEQIFRLMRFENEKK